MNIILTGFMGSGKTSVGKLLAYRLHWQFIDLDDLIVKEESKSINDIFEQDGEKHFRDIETKMIKIVSALDNVVISTGGGVVLRDENMDALERNGKIIYLHADPEAVYERVRQDVSRPLLQVEDPLSEISRLMKKREKYYKRNNYMIDTTFADTEEIATQIQELLDV